MGGRQVVGNHHTTVELYHLLEGCGIALHLVDVGMCDLDASIEHRRASEYDVSGTALIILLRIFHTLEPNEVDYPGAVGETCDQTGLTACGYRLKRKNLPLELDVRHGTVDLADIVYAAPVHIFIWIVIEQVAETDDAEFLLENLCPDRSHSLEVLDVLFELFEHE